MQQSERFAPQSLYDEARREAEASRDWATYLRSKRLEHLYGHCRYVEFEDAAFGCIPDNSQDPALQFVIRHYVEDRWENLQYFCSTIPFRCTSERLLGWLELLGINQLRQFAPPSGLLNAA